MTDPLTEVVSLLRPSARFSKTVTGAGAWHIRRSDAGEPFYCVVLEGGCFVEVDGHEAMALRTGDFLLVPAAHDLSMFSLIPHSMDVQTQPVALPSGEFRIGDLHAPTDLRLLVGHCRFQSPDARLLVSLLPRWFQISDDHRLTMLVKLVGEETRAQRPARDMILARLLEVLLIEAMRSTADTPGSPGLVRGLADTRLANALRAMHQRPQQHWTVGELAREAALSRSTFFERFNGALGVAPMEYLLAWRMALAKDLLRRGEATIAAVAEHVGYSSASTFSVAFTRHVGMPPSHFKAENASASVAQVDPFPGPLSIGF